MHYYIALAIVAFFLFLADVIAIKYNEIMASKTFGDKVTVIRNMRKKPKMFCVFMFVVYVVITVLFAIFMKDESLIFLMKRLGLISILLPATFYDLREYRIPNKLLIFGMILRGVFLIPEVLTEKDFLMIWLYEVIAIVVMFIATVAIALISEESLGMGDLKMFIVMGAYLGLTGLFAALFYSGVAAGISSLFLILTKKKKMKDGIKFAPYMLIGTMIAIILIGA